MIEYKYWRIAHQRGWEWYWLVNKITGQAYPVESLSRALEVIGYA